MGVSASACHAELVQPTLEEVIELWEDGASMEKADDKVEDTVERFVGLWLEVLCGC